MADSFTLTAEVRSKIGTGASRRLRRNEDKVPAIIYGGGKDAIPLTLSHKDMMKALENEAFFSHILTVKVDGKANKAVLKSLQRHPWKKRLLHIDFLRISETEKLTMNVPIHFIGEDIAPGVKTGGGIVSHQMNSVEISCLPKNLPEDLEADLSALELDQTFHLSEIKLPEGVEINALTQTEEHDLPVAAIHVPRVVVIEDEAPVAVDIDGEEDGDEEGKAKEADAGDEKSADSDKKS